MNTKPIGIFDSGVGGLTVMAAIRKLLPHESLIYLGCTHYPLLKPVIRRILGEGVELIDSGEAVALALHDLLTRQSLLNGTKEKVNHQFYVSDLSGPFETLAKRFLGFLPTPIQRASL